MAAARASSIPRYLDRVFAPRQIYISWGGSFHYIRLTAWAQKMAAVGAITVVAWSLLATAGNILDRRSLASRDAEIARQERAYDALERDLGQALENRTKLERRVLGQTAKLNAQLEMLRDELARETAYRLALRGQRDAQSRRLQGLEKRLTGLQDSERGVIERLSERVREGAQAVEKTVAMTGLNVEDLIAGTTGLDTGAERYLQSSLGQGGPYIPAEAVYQQILAQESKDGLDLFQYALSRKIVPVSPQSFYAYLQVIVLGLRGLSIETRAKEIMERLGLIRNRLNRFTESFETAVRHLGNAQRQIEESGRRLARLEAAFSDLSGPPGTDEESKAVGAGLETERRP